MWLIVCVALSFVTGAMIGWAWRGYYETRRHMSGEERVVAKRMRGAKLREWVDRVLPILLVAALCGQVLTTILLLRTTTKVDTTDQKREDALICQVRHNEATAQALQKINSAQKNATKSERLIWHEIKRGILNGTLTAPNIVAVINDHQADLSRLLVRREGKPYPKGALCVQLLPKSDRNAP